MSEGKSRKYIKTKFEGVFYRISSRRDPRTGDPDRVYCFWYADAEGKGHWKTVGRHSDGTRAQTVRQQRAAFLAELAAGSNPALREKVTVGDAVALYAAWARDEGKYVDKPMQQYDKHMRKRLHSVPISSVTPGMLSRIKGELATTPVEGKKIPESEGGSILRSPHVLSPQTIAHQFSFLRRAVNRAIATKVWTGANPFASQHGGPWKMPRVDNKRLRFFTPDEAQKLLDTLATRSRPLRDMALLSLKTGMRATEIFKLRAQDIDAASGILHIIGKGGKREQVYAAEDIIEILLSYGRIGAEYIFSDRNNANSPIKCISRSFKRTVLELGFETPDTESRFAVTFHTFRHTFASWLAQSGKVSLLELKALMRHESLAMTQRYAHLIPGQERERLLIINDMLSTVPKKELLP